MKTLSKAGLLVAGAMAATAIPLAGVAMAGGPVSGVNVTVDPVSPAPRQATIKWTNGTPASGAITGWRVTATGSRDSGVLPANQFAWVLADLKSNKNYEITVYAEVDDSGSVSEVAADTETFNGYSLGASFSRQHIVVGGSTVFRGALTAVGKQPQPGQNVLIQAKPKGNNKAVYKTVATVKTGKGGAWSRTLRPRINTKYRAIYTGKGMGSWTEEYDVIVAPALSIGFSRNPIALGTKVLISGKVLRGNIKALTGQRVSLQRKQGRKWVTLRDLKVSAKGTFRTRFTPGNRTDYLYRWTTGGGPNYGDGFSAPRRLVVN